MHNNNIYHIISTINKHYLIQLSDPIFSAIIIKELDGIPIEDIFNIIYKEHDVISIILNNSTDITIHISPFKYKIPLRYYIEPLKKNIQNNYDFNKNNHITIKITNKLMLYTKSSTLNFHKHNHFYKLYLKIKTPYGWNNKLLLDGVKYIGSPIYNNGLHYVMIFSTKSLFVLKINKCDHEIIFICNINVNYHVFDIGAKYGILTNDTWYVINNEPHHFTNIIKYSQIHNIFDAQIIHYRSKLWNYDIIDNIIAVNYNNINPQKWYIYTHKYFNNYANNIIMSILLCNKYTQFKKISKWLLYNIIKTYIFI